MDEAPLPSGTIVVSKRKLLIGLGVGLLVVVAVVVTFFMMRTDSDGRTDTTNAEETKRIVQLVGTHFELPDDEEPTVAQIQDKSKLSSDQTFFARAQDGDYLLVYKQYKIAFIYRESSNRLINVGPVAFDVNKELNDVR